jgi:SET domain-containing protein
MNPKLEIRKTDKYGKEIRPEFVGGKKIYKNTGENGEGVFTRKNIKKDEMLMVLGGYILTIKDENNLRGIVADKPIEISEEFSIGPLEPSDLELMPQHYINSSCDPNAGFKGQIFLVAMRNIKKGEEIAYDYAMVMNSNEKSNSYFKIKCLCGSKNCRGYIAEDDWKIPELQKRYDGYFQWHLQKKINKIKK